MSRIRALGLELEVVLGFEVYLIQLGLRLGLELGLILASGLWLGLRLPLGSGLPLGLASRSSSSESADRS